MALNSMVVNKMRTLLSLLGITIGIFAIISVFTAVDSLENNVRESVASLGKDVIFIQKWPWGGGKSEYKWWEFIKRPIPVLKELAIVQKKCKSAEAAAFIVSGSKTVKYKNNSVENIQIVSTSHDYDKIVSFEIDRGRYFSAAESLSGRNVTIIGALVSQNLFGNINPLGKNVKTIGRNFKVIGVFKKEGESIIGDTHDTQILLAVNSVRKLLDIHKRHLDPIIMVKAKEGVSNAELKDELTGVLRAARKLKPTAANNFALNETSIISSGLDEIFNVIGLAGWLIGGFSILVGGFGIANIMFVSVKERTSIIGIQKALGAKNYFILLQFLFEAIMLCLIGGGIGLALVYGGTMAANSLVDMEFSLTYSNIVLGLSVSGLIGVLSGFIPAYTASQLNPVVAIRAV